MPLQTVPVSDFALEQVGVLNSERPVQMDVGMSGTHWLAEVGEVEIGEK